MKKMLAAFATALVAVATIALPAAADTTCTGTIGAISIDDTVVVPADGNCTLDGTTVDGNVLVGPRARLTVLGATIEGNVQDDNGNAGAVVVRDSRTDNIQLESGTSLTVRNTMIDGDLQFEQNRGPLLADDNDIHGNLQANQNSAGLTITTNRIDGNLQCQSNDPAPTGGDNVVSGSAEGQCRDLESPAPDPVAPTPDPVAPTPGPGSSTGDRTCTGTIGATTIDDDVIVPANASCTLNGTTVDGNVLVGPRARLTVLGATIQGNVQDDNGNAGAVQIRNSRTDNIQLESGTSLTVRNTRIDGDLQFEQNRGPLLADDNGIDGNLQANQNSGGLTITDNRIDGNLQCQSNSPAPTGGGNQVRGSAEDQCRNLEGPRVPGGPRATSFSDVPAGSTHATAIEWLVGSGITLGCDASGTSFCPTDSVTRAQMASFLDRALDLPSGSASFSDVPAGSTHAAGIGAVAAADITRGCDASGTRFCPTDHVTRAQMASFLDRALDLPSGSATFSDVPAGSTHAAGIGAVAAADITRGCDASGTRYCPTDDVTRAQMATFLYRALGNG